jgi:hypothetical protein
MPDLNCIEDALAATGWNRARIRLLARFIVALLCLQTVSLTRLATILPSRAKEASVYRRLQRFLAQFAFDDATLTPLLARMVKVAPPWELSLDRTDWKLGKRHLNVLLLSIVVVKTKMGFPLLWSVLEKQTEDKGKTGKPGASNTAERIDLLARFVRCFGAESIACLYADREFVGTGWMGYLLDQGIPFQLRIRASILIPDGEEWEGGELAYADWVFRNLGVDQVQYLKGARLVLGRRVYVGAKRIGKETGDDFLIVVSDRPFQIERYSSRWGIETLFSGLKTRGFCLEETHITHPDRLSCLVGVLSIAYCWAFSVGLWLSEAEPLHPKKHGRPPRSCLRRGLDLLRPVALLLCADALADKIRWQSAFQFLSCT